MTASSGSAWFVAQTQPHSEAKAGVHLARQGFEVYCPQYLKTVRHARRVSIIKAALFPSYIFVRIDFGNQRWRAINSTVGVTRLVGHEGIPIPLTAGLVENLKERAGADGFFEMVRRSERFKAGDTIRILNGALNSFYGIFEARTDKDRVAILLDLFGRKSRVVLDAEAIEAA